MKIEVVSDKAKAYNENPIERSFAKVLRYGFAEKSNMSNVAKVALNASVSKRYKAKNIDNELRLITTSKVGNKTSITVNNSMNNSDVVDFREINQRIITKLGQSNSLRNLPKGVRIVG